MLALVLLRFEDAAARGDFEGLLRSWSFHDDRRVFLGMLLWSWSVQVPLLVQASRAIAHCSWGDDLTRRREHSAGALETRLPLMPPPSAGAVSVSVS